MELKEERAVRAQPGRPSWIKKIAIETFSSFRVTPAQVNVFFAVVIGFFSALGAYAFRWLIVTCEHCSFGGMEPGAHGVFSLLGDYDILIMPAIGGLIAGPLIYRWAREAKGHGVPEVITAVCKRGGRIRPIVAVIKSITSIATIGSGGSAGSEGPIIQIGAAFGSSMGQWFRMPPHRITNFLACGAASGIAAIFNAPIAGVMFSMEVILGEFEKFSFIYVVLAAVTSSAVSQYLTGSQSLFSIKYDQLNSELELIAFAFLGIMIAFAARYFTVILVKFEDLFDYKIKIPEYIKASSGGLCLGVTAVLLTMYTQVPGKSILGVGYGTIDMALRGELAFKILLLLFAAKFLATCFTLGSGGSGGVFAPALFMGAMLGGAYGTVLHRLFPNWTAPAGLYAVIGMGAFFAGAAHAPITSILILFEMTGYRYTILLPIMACSVISTLVASLLNRDSIYTIKLRRKGIITDEEKPDPLKSMVVGDVMIRDPQYISEEMSISTLAELVGTKLHTSLPVVNNSGAVVGLMMYKEIHLAMASGRDFKTLKVKEYMKRNPIVAYTDESCATVFNRMKNAAQGIAPVVRRRDPGKLVGIVTYRHIYEAYQKALMY
jgi:CIC family chloride channel protein